MKGFSKLGPCCVFGLLIAAGITRINAEEKSQWEIDFEKCLAVLNGPQFQSAEGCLSAAYTEALNFETSDVRRPAGAHALASFYQMESKLEKASTLYEEARDALEPSAGPESVLLPLTLLNLGDVRFQQGRWPEAEQLLVRSLALYRKTLGEKDPRTAAALNHLGALYVAQHRMPEAESMLRQSVDVQRASLNPKDPQLAASLSNLVKLYLLQQRYREAEPVAREILEIARAGGEMHLEMADSLVDLGTLYRLEGKPARAEPLLRKALWIYERTLGPDHQRAAPALTNLALIRAQEKKFGVAEQHLKLVLDVLTNALGADHIEVAIAETNLAKVYLAEDKKRQAEPLLTHAAAIEKQLPGGSDSMVRNTQSLLAESRGAMPRRDRSNKIGASMR